MLTARINQHKWNINLYEALYSDFGDDYIRSDETYISYIFHILYTYEEEENGGGRF